VDNSEIVFMENKKTCRLQHWWQKGGNFSQKNCRINQSATDAITNPEALDLYENERASELLVS
jgi:hypothetical protein